ncbi:hypothetical protein Bca4012_026687 [Brassica carinata]
MASMIKTSDLNDLHPFKTVWRVDVKVLHKWISFGHQTGASIEMVLSDQNNQDSMASSKDLKMKEPMVDDKESTWLDGYDEAKRERSDHYRDLLRLYKARYEAVKARHVEEVEVERLQAKLEILEKVEKVYDPVNEKERLRIELNLANERMAEVKVPSPDWAKIGKAWLWD